MHNFTSPKADTGRTSPKAAQLGGLQAHSLGGAYPLCVVGYGQGELVTYVVENLTVQSIAGFKNRTLRQWGSVALATEFLEKIISGAPTMQPVVWHTGRAVYNDGRLVMLNKVPLVRFSVNPFGRIA